MSNEVNSSKEQTASLWRKWGSVILGGLLLFLAGLEVGAEAMRQKSRGADAVLAEAQTKVEQATASLADAQGQVATATLQAERLKAGYVDALGMVANLTEQLKEARTVQPMQPIAPAEQSRFTVLYDVGQASLNIALLNLPGAPRVSLGPGGQLAPRWVVPGQVQPRMLGDARQAMYYFYDSSNSTWQGPFAPQRAAQ